MCQMSQYDRGIHFILVIYLVSFCFYADKNITFPLYTSKSRLRYNCNQAEIRKYGYAILIANCIDTLLELGNFFFMNKENILHVQIQAEVSF